MRIALIGPTHPFRGGISHYTTLLCRALRERHEVRFFSLTRQYPGLLFPGETQRDESDGALDAANEPCIDSLNPLSWFETADRVAGCAAELLLISWWQPFFAPAFGTIARLAKARSGIPSCFLCHNALPHEPSLLDRLLLHYAYGSATQFIAHSAEDRENLRKFCPRTPARVSPHPTYSVFAPDSPLSESEAKAALGLADKKVLLFFGFVRAYKGLEYLIEALESLDPTEGYHLLVVGEFYEKREKYRAGLDRLRRRNQLTLVDSYVPNEEIQRYFAAADLVVAPYLSATQSGVVQLAYAFRKPVIATAVGGLPETVLHGRTGYLVPVADAEAIAQRARAYFADADRERFRSAIAEQSRNFSWERLVETIEAVGQELAGCSRQ